MVDGMALKDGKHDESEPEGCDDRNHHQACPLEPFLRDDLVEEHKDSDLNEIDGCNIETLCEITMMVSTNLYFGMGTVYKSRKIFGISRMFTIQMSFPSPFFQPK